MAKTAMTGARRDEESRGSTETSEPNPTSAPTTTTINMPSANISENSSLQITTTRLNSTNFLQWSRSALMVIRGRGRLGYITGATKQPAEEDAAYATWDAQNSMVMAWIVNSMEEDIKEPFLYYTTAKELWDALTMTFSDLGNSAQLFELRNRARDLRQGEQDVTQYYNALTRLWKEIDLFVQINWETPGDVEKYRKQIEKERIYDFLAGLNPELDEVRGRLLGIKPTPLIAEIFAEVRREASRKRVMLGGSKNLLTESSALAARGQETFRPNRRSNLWCDYCKKPNHTKDKCWKLHGRPAKQGNREDNRQGYREDTRPNPRDTVSSYQSSAEGSLPKPSVENMQLSLTKDQLERLYKLLTPAPAVATSSGSLLAQRGNFISACKISKIGPWIIDSGATDHMTGC